MQAIVVKRFRDKYTGQRYKPGDIFEGDETRIGELLNHEKGPLVVEMVDKIPPDEELLGDESPAEPPADDKKASKGGKNKSASV